jgi:mannan endo-1,4-beta-mannosidase
VERSTPRYSLRNKMKKLMVTASVSALTFSLLPAASLQKAKADTGETLLEAENAILNGVTVQSSQPGYSGTGYVGNFSDSSQSVTFNVNAHTTALYNLNVGFGAIYGSGKVANLSVNGKPAGSFTMGNGFGDVSAGNVLLNAGANTITITPNWTWFAIDYIKIKPAPAPVPHQVEKTLINSKATKETRALMSYLVDNFGKNILSGQYEFPNTRPTDLDFIYKNTGKYPAVLGLDFIDNSPSRVEHGTSADETKAAIDWWKKGGIVTFSWHWSAPKDLLDEPGNEWWSGFYTRATTFDVDYAVNHPESEDYKLLIRDIDVIAGELKKLQDAGVPVLWRPLHEAEGGWFWWGAKGPEPTKKLWRIMYDRMTNYHHLNNLIWVWNSISQDWYPGDDYLDVVTFDSYPGANNYGPASSQYEALVKLSSNKKLVAMAENGPIPDPDLLPLYHANYSWFTTWNGSVLSDQNSIEHLKEVYNSDYVKTLDELPKISTYLEDTQMKKIAGLLEGYAKSGDLSGPAYVQTANSFKQVEEQYKKGHLEQAKNHLTDLQKHLNNGELQTISAEAKKVVLANAGELMQIFSE